MTTLEEIQVRRHAHRHRGRREVDRIGDQRHARGARAPAGRARPAVRRAARARPDQGRRGLCSAAIAACPSAARRSPRTRSTSTASTSPTSTTASASRRVPYAFYKEFQVKTGGYSVEFGRTTGGVINAVTRSGTNEFEFGTEVVWEPSFAADAQATTISTATATRTSSAATTSTTARARRVYASGPIVKDQLFFFALYEARDYEPRLHRRRRQQLLRGEGGRRLLGREDRLADQRSATCWSCSRSPTRTRKTRDAFGFDLPGRAARRVRATRASPTTAA